MTDVVRDLDVRADLTLEVGDDRASVVADGRRVVITADDPAALWRSLNDVSLPAAVRRPTARREVARAGELLDSLGLSVRVDGPRGTVIELGRGCGSRAGRVLLGTDTVSLGGSRSLVPAAAGLLGSPRTLRRAAVAAATLVAVLVVGGRSLHRSGTV